MDSRAKQGKKAQPSIAIIDSQSSKNSSTCGKNIGIDGGKLIKERKRFYIVDTLGNLLDNFVVAANCHDGTAGARYWESLYYENILLDNIVKIYADGTFIKEMIEKYDIVVEISKNPATQNHEGPTYKRIQSG